jgi:hypothetical protein
MQITIEIRLGNASGAAVTGFTGHAAARRAAEWMAQHPGHVAVRVVL